MCVFDLLLITLVISPNSPYLGASPDGKVIDPGCSNPFGLSEVKYPESNYVVTPLDACSDGSFSLEEVNGMPKATEANP